MKKTEHWNNTVISLALAGLVLASWVALHVVSIFFIDWSANGLWLFIPLVIAIQMWLSVGLFIIAHDSMHGSLAQGHSKLNRLIGQVCVGIYAGFSYDKLFENHHAHHRQVGTADDPDFDVDHPSRFWPWYIKFFRHYFGLRELLVLTMVCIAYYFILGPRYPIILVFWALPAILSSLQLFYFGTYRPHRINDVAFSDGHRARSDDFPWLLSLLTCFHFGYHHEHHDKPGVPWWKLPEVRKISKTAVSI